MSRPSRLSAHFRASARSVSRFAHLSFTTQTHSADARALKFTAFAGVESLKITHGAVRREPGIRRRRLRSSHELSTWAKSRHITEHDDVASCQDGITSSCMGVHFASSILVTSTASSKPGPLSNPSLAVQSSEEKRARLQTRAPFALPPTQLRASFHCSCCRLSAGVLLEEMPRRLPRRGAAGRIPDDPDAHGRLAKCYP